MYVYRYDIITANNLYEYCIKGLANLNIVIIDINNKVKTQNLLILHR